MSPVHVLLCVQKIGKARTTQAMAFVGATVWSNQDECMLSFMVSNVVEPSLLRTALSTASKSYSHGKVDPVHTELALLHRNLP